jgi:hypothetical protein
MPEGYNERIVFRKSPKNGPEKVGVLRYYQKADGSGDGSVRVEPGGYKLKKIEIPFKGVSSKELQKRLDNWPPNDIGRTEYYQAQSELKRRGYERPAPPPPKVVAPPPRKWKPGEYTAEIERLTKKLKARDALALRSQKREEFALQAEAEAEARQIRAQIERLTAEYTATLSPSPKQR